MEHLLLETFFRLIITLIGFSLGAFLLPKFMELREARNRALCLLVELANNYYELDAGSEKAEGGLPVIDSSAWDEARMDRRILSYLVGAIRPNVYHKVFAAYQVYENNTLQRRLSRRHRREVSEAFRDALNAYKVFLHSEKAYLFGWLRLVPVRDLDKILSIHSK